MDYKALYKERAEAQKKSGESWKAYNLLKDQLIDIKSKMAIHDDDGRYWSRESERIKKEMDEGIKE